MWLSGDHIITYCTEDWEGIEICGKTVSGKACQKSVNQICKKKKQNERTITNVLIHPIIYSGFMCEDKSIGYI